jgi:hypothetical protein
LKEQTRSKLALQAERLALYTERIRAALAQTDRRKLQNALADIAEAGEIARRLYRSLSQAL